MTNERLIWTAWNNGQHHGTGSGYGLKVPKTDRDRYFDREQHSVNITLPDSGEEVSVNTEKKSFWSDTCRELISHELGRWLLRTGLAPWPNGNPPKIHVMACGNGRFEILNPVD